MSAKGRDMGESNPVPPAPAPNNAESPPQESRKTKTDDVFPSHDRNYFKIRAILGDLRPFFIQLLQAPDFRSDKAAHEVQKYMKTMIDLLKEMKNGASFPSKQVAHQTVNEEHLDRLQEEEKNATGEAPIPSQAGHRPTAPEKLPGKAPEEKPAGERLVDGIEGTYIVGGSPLGWNFILYPHSLSEYYGETKASVLLRRAAKNAEEKA